MKRSSVISLMVFLSGVAATSLTGDPVRPEEFSNERRQKILERGIVSRGDTTRLERVMRRAEAGEEITLGFIGGSITQGGKARPKDRRYADLIVDWWRKTFPEAKFKYVNAGVGATGSSFGAFRAEHDLLKHKPDFVVFEFSVNDTDRPRTKATGEGLVRQILSQPNRPALLMLHMMAEGGTNVQDLHAEVGNHYNLQQVSYRDGLWPEIEAGRLGFKEVTADNVHPNNAGHVWTARFVTHLLEKVHAGLKKDGDDREASEKGEPLPEPLVTDAYQYTRIYHFQPDGARGEYIKPVRKDEGWHAYGQNRYWRALKPGARIVFDIPSGRIVSIRYWRLRRPDLMQVKAWIKGKTEPNVFDGWTDIRGFGYKTNGTVATDLGDGPNRLIIETLDKRTGVKKTDEEPHPKRPYVFKVHKIFVAGVEPSAQKSEKDGE